MSFYKGGVEERISYCIEDGHLDTQRWVRFWTPLDQEQKEDWPELFKTTLNDMRFEPTMEHGFDRSDPVSGFAVTILMPSGGTSFIEGITSGNLDDGALHVCMQEGGAATCSMTPPDSSMWANYRELDLLWTRQPEVSRDVDTQAWMEFCNVLITRMPAA